MSSRLAGIFFCCTLLIIGSIVLLINMSLDYNTVIYACGYSIFGAIIAGFFGYYIGKILDSSNHSRNKHKNSKKTL